MGSSYMGHIYETHFIWTRAFFPQKNLPLFFPKTHPADIIYLA